MWKRAKIPYFPPFLIHGTWWENGKGFHSGGGGGGFPHGFHVESTGNCGRWCFFFFSQTCREVSPAGDLLLPLAAIRERSPTAHFSQQLEKWAKEPEETKGFFTSLRAMSIANLTLPAARSRKSSCIVPSKDCLSNSAAAADWFAEQRFWFYRCSA